MKDYSKTLQIGDIVTIETDSGTLKGDFQVGSVRPDSILFANVENAYYIITTDKYGRFSSSHEPFKITKKGGDKQIGPYDSVLVRCKQKPDGSYEENAEWVKTNNPLPGKTCCECGGLTELKVSIEPFNFDLQREIALTCLGCGREIVGFTERGWLNSKTLMDEKIAEKIEELKGYMKNGMPEVSDERDD